MSGPTIRHAFKWNALAQGVAAVGQVIITLLLVRLLDPAAFGRVALVYLIIGFVALLDEGGFSTKLVETADQDRKRLSVVFFQEFLLGLVLFLAIALLAPLLSAIFEQQDLVDYLLVIAPVFILTGPRRFYLTLFVRNLDFKRIGIVRMTAVLIYLLITLVLAKAGYGVWSLVIGLIVRILLEAIGFTVLGWRLFHPIWVPFSQWSTGYGRPGIIKVGERFLNYLIERLDLLIIGKALGPNALGVYDVFKRLSIGLYQQVIPMFSRIALPQLARFRQQPKKLAAAYLRHVRLICYLLFPAYIFQAAFAKTVVTVVFGQDWAQYAVVFVWISLLLLVRSISGPLDALLMARGFVKREFWYAMATVVLLCGTMIYVVSGGLEATITAITALYIAMLFPVYQWVVRPASGAGKVSYLKAIFLPLMMSLIAALVTWFSSELLAFDSSKKSLLLLAAVYVVSCFFYLLTVEVSFRKRLKRVLSRLRRYPVK